MTLQLNRPTTICLLLIGGLLAVSSIVSRPVVRGQEEAKEQQSGTRTGKTFENSIQPLFEKYCVHCHNADLMTSGIRVDHLTGDFADRQLFLWKDIQKQLVGGHMPPKDEDQPSTAERKRLTDWIRAGMNAARSREPKKNGSARRLTVAQYRNTLRDLLGIDDDFTDIIPPDTGSRDGFANNQQSMVLSPLLIESYFDIAEQALDACLIDEKTPPVVQSFRMDLGKAINPNPLPDKLILGANSLLLANEDFLVTELQPSKPFDYRPFEMRTQYRFIEGYQGNATVRGWREYDSIYHAVFACMRGTRGYPKGKAYETASEGLLLRPAIPSPELFGQSSTYGPQANFKISLRELPEHGRFRMKVKAAKYNDGLLLDANVPVRESNASLSVPGEKLKDSTAATINVKRAGVYQVDVFAGQLKQPMLSLSLGDRRFSGQLRLRGKKDEQKSAAFLWVRLPAGELKLSATLTGNKPLGRMTLTRLNDDNESAKAFLKFERRAPRLGVHVGLRRDCGSTLAPVGPPQSVARHELQEFVFEGAIKNFPRPEVEKSNVNYLAGVREIGVRSEYTDGRDMPRLLIRSVEFEGPFYETWPPATHRRIFVEFDQTDDPPAYAKRILREFATRAFRRPVTDGELTSLLKVWRRTHTATGDFQRGIKDALLVALTSPQFLFIVEQSASPDAEPLNSYELASKLSYFLWNAPPDGQLSRLAAADALHKSLDSEISRMIRDPRFTQFTNEFTTQWLGVDQLDVVEVDRKQFPKLTRDTKTQLKREPVEFLQHLMRSNLPLRNLIESDFVVVNETVADYYGLGDRVENGFDFEAIPHRRGHLGGVLSQAGILASLSNGRESHPVKRGAWFARKIIAEPPDDPPPNVPALPEENADQLSLREQLERHRNQDGCKKCHAGIDPWGLPFEQFDAGGLLKDAAVDARSTLPDETTVDGLRELKSYLANDRMDRVAFSFLKHLTSYAIGRDLSYRETEYLKEQTAKLKADEYRTQDLLRFVVNSPMFQEK